MRRLLAFAAVVAVAAAAGAAWFVLLRPGVEVSSEADPDVTIVCTASASVADEDCRRWGDSVLTQGAPSSTFEMEDLARLTLDRPLFADECRVTYGLQRYPDDAAWTDSVPCLSR